MVPMSMVEIQTAFSQFQAPGPGFLRKWWYSEQEFSIADDFGESLRSTWLWDRRGSQLSKPLDIYTSMIVKQARWFDTINKLQHTLYTTSAHKILGFYTSMIAKKDRCSIPWCYHQATAHYVGAQNFSTWLRRIWLLTVVTVLYSTLQTLT